MLNAFRAPHGEPPPRDPIEVRVRCQWEHDGEVWQRGVAIRWDDTYVVIQLSDPELAGKYVYVQAQDVKRANDWSRPD